MPEDAVPAACGWADCHCCGRSYPAVNMVRFHAHPDDALCVTCVAWLSERSRPIVRRLYPVWQLPARVRAARTRRCIPTDQPA